MIRTIENEGTSRDEWNHRTIQEVLKCGIQLLEFLYRKRWITKELNERLRKCLRFILDMTKETVKEH